jgi:hypothetical protein
LVPQVERTNLDLTPGDETSLPPGFVEGLVRLQPGFIPHPGRDFWEQVSEIVGTPQTATTSRSMVTQAILSRTWRRFAWRVDYARAGWHGCGLAEWDLHDNEAIQAAGALARIRGTADVCVRKPSTEFPHAVSAVLIGREPGSGAQAAARISEQWGRPLARWTDLEFSLMGEWGEPA